MSETETEQILACRTDDSMDRSRGRHIGALDGLRAIAIIGVLFAHIAPALFFGGTYLRNTAKIAIGQGGLGVDLFFALSGFLITGILVDSKSMRSASFFYTFYKRRSLRIFPAYYAFLFPLFFVPSLFQHLSRWGFVLYIRNWLGPDSSSDGVLGHLWSLAVEEQFYLVWAPVVFFSTRKVLPWLMIVLSLLVIPGRLWLAANNYSSYDIVRFTTSRLDGFLLGGLVAIAWRHQVWSRVASWSYVLAPIALLGYILNLKLGDRYQWVLFSSYSAVFFAAIIVICLNLPSLSVASRLLSNPVFKKIAQYSYAIYLWHLVVNRLLAKILMTGVRHFGLTFGTTIKLAYLPVVFLMIYGVAAISWKLVEEPFLRFKR